MLTAENNTFSQSENLPHHKSKTENAAHLERCLQNVSTSFGLGSTEGQNNLNSAEIIEKLNNILKLPMLKPEHTTEAIKVIEQVEEKKAEVVDILAEVIPVSKIDNFGIVVDNVVKESLDSQNTLQSLDRIHEDLAYTSTEWIESISKPAQAPKIDPPEKVNLDHSTKETKSQQVPSADSFSSNLDVLDNEQYPTPKQPLETKLTVSEPASRGNGVLDNNKNELETIKNSSDTSEIKAYQQIQKINAVSKLHEEAKVLIQSELESEQAKIDYTWIRYNKILESIQNENLAINHSVTEVSEKMILLQDLLSKMDTNLLNAHQRKEKLSSALEKISQTVLDDIDSAISKIQKISKKESGLKPIFTEFLNYSAASKNEIKEKQKQSQQFIKKFEGNVNTIIDSIELVRSTAKDIELGFVSDKQGVDEAFKNFSDVVGKLELELKSNTDENKHEFILLDKFNDNVNKISTEFELKSAILYYREIKEQLNTRTKGVIQGFETFEKVAQTTSKIQQVFFRKADKYGKKLSELSDKTIYASQELENQILLLQNSVQKVESDLLEKAKEFGHNYRNIEGAAAAIEKEMDKRKAEFQKLILAGNNQKSQNSPSDQVKVSQAVAEINKTGILPEILIDDNGQKIIKTENGDSVSASDVLAQLKDDSSNNSENDTPNPFGFLQNINPLKLAGVMIAGTLAVQGVKDFQQGVKQFDQKANQFETQLQNLKKAEQKGIEVQNELEIVEQLTKIREFDRLTTESKLNISEFVSALILGLGVTGTGGLGVLYSSLIKNNSDKQKLLSQTQKYLNEALNSDKNQPDAIEEVATMMLDNLNLQNDPIFFPLQQFLGNKKLSTPQDITELENVLKETASKIDSTYGPETRAKILSKAGAIFAVVGCIASSNILYTEFLQNQASGIQSQIEQLGQNQTRLTQQAKLTQSQIAEANQKLNNTTSQLQPKGFRVVTPQGVMDLALNTRGSVQKVQNFIENQEYKSLLEQARADQIDIRLKNLQQDSDSDEQEEGANNTPKGILTSGAALMGLKIGSQLLERRRKKRFQELLDEQQNKGKNRKSQENKDTELADLITPSQYEQLQVMILKQKINPNPNLRLENQNYSPSLVDSVISLSELGLNVASATTMSDQQDDENIGFDIDGDRKLNYKIRTKEKQSLSEIRFAFDSRNPQDIRNANNFNSVLNNLLKQKSAFNQNGVNFNVKQNDLGETIIYSDSNSKLINLFLKKLVAELQNSGFKSTNFQELSDSLKTLSQGSHTPANQNNQRQNTKSDNKRSPNNQNNNGGTGQNGNGGGGGNRNTPKSMGTPEEPEDEKNGELDIENMEDIRLPTDIKILSPKESFSREKIITRRQILEKLIEDPKTKNIAQFILNNTMYGELYTLSNTDFQKFSFWLIKKLNDDKSDNYLKHPERFFKNNSMVWGHNHGERLLVLYGVYLKENNLTNFKNAKFNLTPEKDDGITENLVYNIPSTLTTKLSEIEQYLEAHNYESLNKLGKITLIAKVLIKEGIPATKDIIYHIYEDFKHIAELTQNFVNTSKIKSKRVEFDIHTLAQEVCSGEYYRNLNANQMFEYTLWINAIKDPDATKFNKEKSNNPISKLYAIEDGTTRKDELRYVERFLHRTPEDIAKDNQRVAAYLAKIKHIDSQYLHPQIKQIKPNNQLMPEKQEPKAISTNTAKVLTNQEKPVENNKPKQSLNLEGQKSKYGELTRKIGLKVENITNQYNDPFFEDKLALFTRDVAEVNDYFKKERDDIESLIYNASNIDERNFWESKLKEYESLVESKSTILADLQEQVKLKWAERNSKPEQPISGQLVQKPKEIALNNYQKPLVELINSCEALTGEIGEIPELPKFDTIKQNEAEITKYLKDLGFNEKHSTYSVASELHEQEQKLEKLQKDLETQIQDNIYHEDTTVYVQQMKEKLVEIKSLININAKNQQFLKGYEEYRDYMDMGLPEVAQGEVELKAKTGAGSNTVTVLSFSKIDGKMWVIEDTTGRQYNISPRDFKFYLKGSDNKEIPLVRESEKIGENRFVKYVEPKTPRHNITTQKNKPLSHERKNRPGPRQTVDVMSLDGAEEVFKDKMWMATFIELVLEASINEDIDQNATPLEITNFAYDHLVEMGFKSQEEFRKAYHELARSTRSLPKTFAFATDEKIACFGDFADAIKNYLRELRVTTDLDYKPKQKSEVRKRLLSAEQFTMSDTLNAISKEKPVLSESIEKIATLLDFASREQPDLVQKQENMFGTRYTARINYQNENRASVRKSFDIVIQPSGVLINTTIHSDRTFYNRNSTPIAHETYENQESHYQIDLEGNVEGEYVQNVGGRMEAKLNNADRHVRSFGSSISSLDVLKKAGAAGSSKYFLDLFLKSLK